MCKRENGGGYKNTHRSASAAAASAAAAAVAAAAKTATNTTFCKTCGFFQKVLFSYPFLPSYVEYFWPQNFRKGVAAAAAAVRSFPRRKPWFDWRRWLKKRLVFEFDILPYLTNKNTPLSQSSSYLFIYIFFKKWTNVLISRTMIFLCRFLIPSPTLMSFLWWSTEIWNWVFLIPPSFSHVPPSPYNVAKREGGWQKQDFLTQCGVQKKGESNSGVYFKQDR